MSEAGKSWPGINVNHAAHCPQLVQSGASDRSLGLEDEDLGSSPGWWAATVATYRPSRLGELTKFLSSKPCQ